LPRTGEKGKRKDPRGKKTSWSGWELASDSKNATTLIEGNMGGIKGARKKGEKTNNADIGCSKKSGFRGCRFRPTSRGVHVVAAVWKGELHNQTLLFS